MSETVRVEFDPPRQCKEYEKAWCLSADGEPPVYLPKSETELEREGEVVVAAMMPGWLAEKEGLEYSSTSSFQESGGYQEEQTHDTMTRADWCYLGMAMALVIRGEVPDQAVTHDARRLAERLLRK